MCLRSFDGNDINLKSVYMTNKYKQIFIENKFPWCSGYHVCLTRRRSPVRNRAAPCPFFSFGFGLLQSLNHSAAEPSLGGCGFSWCSGYHVCFTRTRSPVRSRAGTIFSEMHRVHPFCCFGGSDQSYCPCPAARDRCLLIVFLLLSPWSDII